jgi:hypothetical protein
MVPPVPLDTGESPEQRIFSSVEQAFGQGQGLEHLRPASRLSVERERGRVVGRNDWDVAVEVSASTARSHLRARAEKSCHSGDAEGDDYPRADQGDLGFEIVPACRDLTGLGCPVGRRVTFALLDGPTFDDVGDVGALSVQSRLCEKNVKFLPGGPEEWHASGVLFRAGSLANNHQIGPDVSVSIHAPEDDLVAGACERATLAALRTQADRCEFHERTPFER